MFKMTRMMGLAVIGKKELNNGFPDCSNSFRIRMNNHAVLDLSNAGCLENAGTFNFHNAGTTNPNRAKARFMAEGWNGNAR